MILGLEDMKYLKVADINDDTYYFVDDGTATKEDKKLLKGHDESFLFMNDKHMILNYQDLV